MNLVVKKMAYNINFNNLNIFCIFLYISLIKIIYNNNFRNKQKERKKN
jgi:hypothetical protein